MRYQGFLQSKFLNLLELGIAIFLVLACNIFEWIPFPETIFIVLLAIVSIKIQRKGWGYLGFRKPTSWGRLFLIGAVVAVGLQLSSFLTDPLIERLTGEPSDLSSFDEIKGNPTLFAIYFMLIWTLAAFGEEISYRGYMLTKTAELMGSSKIAWWFAVIVTSALFGLAHYYKGPSGMIDSTISGFVFGCTYILSGRNIWQCIFCHGMVDTLGLILLYNGIGN